MVITATADSSERYALATRRGHSYICAAQEACELPRIANRLIAEAVVSTPLSGTLTMKNAGSSGQQAIFIGTSMADRPAAVSLPDLGPVPPSPWRHRTGR
jgi:hypothetical protein